MLPCPSNLQTLGKRSSGLVLGHGHHVTSPAREDEEETATTRTTMLKTRRYQKEKK